MTEAWTTVSRTKNSEKKASKLSESKGSSKKVKPPAPYLNMALEAPEFSLSEFSQTIEDLRSTSFCRRLLESVATSRYEALVGLGLGSFSSSSSSRMQLALLCILGEKFSTADGSTISNMCIFDPIMSTQDQTICLTLGIPVLTDNLKGKHDNKGISTLYFMPHCPYRLYCNLLWSNWNNLSTTFILGNSFTSYSLRRISNSSHTEDLTDCVMRLLPYLTEVELWSSVYSKEARTVSRLSALEHAFCDLSLMCLKVGMDDDVNLGKTLSCRASEEAVNESSLLDEELF